MDRSTRWEMIREAVDGFRFAGKVVDTSPVAGGHIHGNFLVTCQGGRYVLQRLNESVFPDIALLLSNVERVATHLKAIGHGAPELVFSQDGRLSFRTADGATWRAFHFLEGTVEGHTLSRPDAAFEAARCFADYMVAMGSLPGAPLRATIERFHDLPHRIATLEVVATTDPVGRRSSVRHQIDHAVRLSRAVVDELRSRGEPTPGRTVHNDAKLANVRFDATTGRAACVVDLDTTMPGAARHDVGELVRTTTSHTPEDASDTAHVDFDLDLLDAVSAGYFAGNLEIQPSEIETLAVAGPEMAIENALRFLTDYLAGDRYFAIHRPHHNLDRCRTQLRLTELMLDSLTEADASFRRASPRHTPADPVANGSAERNP